ncbi:MAG: DNA polymerase III subunit delta [Actinobacteria bacterium]|nr:DNA polymerase III subunit delta [Actinomycetota bacterium]
MPEEKNKIDKLKKAYLYISRNPSVLEEKVGEIKSFIEDKINTETDYKVFRPDSENTDGELENYISTPSLFSSRKIAVIRNIEKFNAKFQKTIAKTINGQDIVFILTASSEKINKALLDALKQEGSIKKLRPPAGKDMLKWLENKASVDGIVFTDEAKSLLIENVNLDQNLLKNEYSKLYDYISSEDKKIIEGKAVRHLVPRVYSMKIFDLVDYLGGRDKNGSIAALEEILSEDSNLLGLITLIHRMFKSMLYIKTGDGTTGVTAFLEKNINMPPYFIGKLVNKYIKFSRNYSNEEIVKIFDLLNDYDIKFRIDPSENKNLAKRMIAQITDIKSKEF